MSERPKVCIDRLLPRDLHRFQPAVRQRGGGMRALIVAQKLWMNGTTLRVRFMDGDAAQQATARQEALWWAEHANLHFDFNNAADAEIRIRFDADDGAWSYVGTDCRAIPTDQPTMNLGFLEGGTAAHEFGHAIGMGHEHQNPDGGLQWDETAVLRDLSGPPNNWDAETIRHNVLRKYSVNQIRSTRFDPGSIMLYAFPAKWNLNGLATRANEVLSAMDKTFIAGAAAYPKTKPTVDDAVELEIDAKKRTPAAIGKVGEEDLFKFRVVKGGRYAIDTRGPTDVVMRLYGPDSQTDVIAEDDDSGYDSNARIVADLIPGLYYTQVRHYNRAGGVGNYSIMVRRL